MFYNQPFAHRFGKALADDLENVEWQRAEMAVAWIRRSGTKHVASAFRKFLRGGGIAQITVGVDIENTSHEGLSDLLSWQSDGSMETYIHHNEASVVFHPKVYLFRNDTNARLIVGSNNLTEAGLFLNTEAGLQLDAPLDDPVITDARIALAAWRDSSDGLARRLDNTLLNDMLSLGYIFPETELQRRRTESQKRSKNKRPAGSQVLFKFQRVTRPKVPPASGRILNVAGTILLMRVRRSRGTQVQIPFRLYDMPFFAGFTSMVSAQDGHPRGLNPAGGRNTLKVEMPETGNMTDPVLRLERTPTGILYEVFDSASVLGAPIRQALLNGFAMNPPQTFQTIPDRASATWWRFV
jgi:hypothetical protein